MELKQIFRFPGPHEREHERALFGWEKRRSGAVCRWKRPHGGPSEMLHRNIWIERRRRWWARQQPAVPKKDGIQPTRRLSALIVSDPARQTRTGPGHGQDNALPQAWRS